MSVRVQGLHQRTKCSMNTKVGGIPRYQPFDGPALFRQGFRPFFLGAGIWAFAAVALWLPVFHGYASIPTAFGPGGWHAHEMIFGFVVAVVAGFVLTAIPNWTGRMPLQGLSLVALFMAWLLGRVAVSTSELIGSEIAAVLDLSFLVILLGVVAREIVAGRNWRNLPIPVALTLLLVANALTHADAVGLMPTGAVGNRLGIAIVIMLINLIGGRIIPSFTRNWLAKRGDPRAPASTGRLDQVVLAVTAVVLAAWVITPESRIVGVGLVAASFAILVRLLRWRGYLTLAEPMVWSLHLGFAWVPVGLMLVGLGTLGPDLPPTAGLHALTAGAMGAMTLAVMTRATLGHTGRPLVADPCTIAIYLFAWTAAALRVAAPLMVEAYAPLLWASGLAWSAAFGLFSVHYGRMFLSRRGAPVEAA